MCVILSILTQTMREYLQLFVKHQRSLAGYMVQFESPHGLHLNVVTMFQAWFDAAWNRAQPIDTPGQLHWWFKRNWQWWVYIVTAVLAIPFGNSVWGGIIGSVSATFLFNALVASWPMLREYLHKITGGQTR